MTWLGDVANQALAKMAIVPRALTATVTSAAVDMGTAGGISDTLVMMLGAVSGTGSPTLDVRLTESSATDGTYTDIAGASFAQQTTSKTDGNDLSLSTTFVRQYRYVKVAAVVGGTTSPSFTAGVAVLAQKKSI